MGTRKKRFFSLAIIIFAFGMITAPWEGHEKWFWRGLIGYSIPLFCMLFRSQKIQENGMIIGMALVLQTLISPIFFNYYQDVDLITSKPNTTYTKFIPKGIYPGLHGPQLIKIDHKGYAVTKPINYANKPPAHFRIFTLGGSTTAGYPFIGIEKNWPHLLQEKLNKNLSNVEVEVINAGISATRIKHHLATLKKILPYSPDMVVFLIGLNDWDRHIKVIQDNNGLIGKFIGYDFVEKYIVIRGVDPKYSKAFWEFREAVRFDHTILAETISLIKRRLKSKQRGAKPCPQDKPDCLDTVEDGSYMNKQMGGLYRADKRTFRPKTVSPLYEHYLGEVRSICQSNNIDCLFLTQPTAYYPEAKKEIKDRLWMVPANRDYTLDFDSFVHISELYNNYLIGFTKKNKLPLCDVASQIEPSIDNFIDDCHYNILGAKKVANAVSSCIMELRQNS